MRRIFYVLMICASAFMLASCGNSGTTGATSGTTGGTSGTTGGTSGTTGTPITASSTPTGISLSPSVTSIKSDGSSTSVVTATVLDANNAVVSAATVLFSASGGQISTSNAVTGADGTATMTLGASTDKTNQVITVTAQLGNVTPVVQASVPILVTGTTVALQSQTSNITSNGSLQDTLSIKVQDAGNNPVFSVPVTIAQSGTGAVTITQTGASTDVNGTVSATIVGTAAGSVTVTVTAAGATATQTYTVATVGAAFGIASPTTDPYALSTAAELPIVVNAPAGITTVTFAASFGGVSLAAAGVKTGSLDVPVVAGQATAYFSSAIAGISDIQVFDKNVPTTFDVLRVAVSQPASAASSIALQSNVNVVAPSAGSTNTATLTATVRSASGQVVGNAPVHFTIPSPTGAGESISPVIVYTNSFGKAQATFVSGSVGSGSQGVDIYASVLGTATSALPVNIVVGGTAGSVVIGGGTKIVEISPTQYSYPMSVQVSDSNGNGVANAVVSLNLWPSFYRFGYWYSTAANGTSCVPVPFFTAAGSGQPNEDANRNLLLDTAPPEDQSLAVGIPTLDIYGNPARTPAGQVIIAQTFATPANDGRLTPPNSSAGSIPATVTTDTNGIANFNLDFLKQYSAWIIVDVKASTQVHGTEVSSVLQKRLGYTVPDADKCLLPNSPFNEAVWSF